jgi:PKHD-type hydroxylase
MQLTGNNLKCPWAWWNDSFSDDQIEEIKSLKNDFPFIDGLTGEGEGVKSERRSSDIFFVYKDNQYGWIFDNLDQTVNSLNQDYFHFDLYELNSFQYTKYEKKDDVEDHYGWHWDMHTGSGRAHQRKLSIVLQLSDGEDYEGGDLILAPGGDLTTMEKKKGSIIAFPSFVNHQVTPVTKGVRETLVAWYTGPDWR